VSCAGPPACHLLLAAWRPRRRPGAVPARHAALPLIPSSLSLPGSPSISVLLPVPSWAPRPSPSLTVPRRPGLLRASPQLRHLLLFLPARRIEPKPPETPPTPPFSPQEPTAAAPKYAAAGTSPAKPPPPASLG
jgi:hypothetical protein